jgi:hypothetical protein
MAVVVLHYIPRGKHAKAKAKATLSYNGRRAGKDKVKMQRVLFGHGGELTEEQAERMIDEAPKNTYFWRVILSPDPTREDQDKDLDIRQLTKDVIVWLEDRLHRAGKIPFIAAEHNDHTDKRHIHAVALIQRFGKEKMITREILAQLYQAATDRALTQRVARDQSQEQARPQQTREKRGGQLVRLPALRSERHAGGRRLAVDTHPCPACGPGQAMQKLARQLYRCPACGLVDRGRSFGLEASL